MKKIQLSKINVDITDFQKIMEKRFPNGDVDFILAKVEGGDFEDIEIREYFNSPLRHKGLLDFWFKNTNLKSELERLEVIKDYFDYSLIVKYTYQRNHETGPFKLLSGLAWSFYYGGSYGTREPVFTFKDAAAMATKTIINLLEGNELEYSVEQIIVSGLHTEYYFGVMQRERKLFFLKVLDID